MKITKVADFRTAGLGSSGSELNKFLNWWREILSYLIKIAEPEKDSSKTIIYSARNHCEVDRLLVEIREILDEEFIIDTAILNCFLFV